MIVIPKRLAPFLLLAALLVPRPALAEDVLRCNDIGDLVTLFFQKHIAHRNLDPELLDRAVDVYLERVDPQRTLFLESEVAALRPRISAAFSELRKGNCVAIHGLHNDVMERLQVEESAVRAMMADESYKVVETAELVIDPEKRGYPESSEDARKTLETLVHFQISNYLNSGEEIAEAKKKLVHRYELRTRRWAQQDREELYAGFLKAFASALDPHSAYFSADDLEDFQIGMQLSLEGIGVALSERDGYAVVEKIIPGGAASRLDVLEPKDKIIAVAEKDGDWVDVIDMPLRDIVRLIRGKKGSVVNLTVLRQAERIERFNIAITRDKVDLAEQAANLRFEDVERGDQRLKLAVIELPSFYGDRDPTKRQASRDIARLLEQVREEKADGLLLDLSRNGGGLLEDAVRITGFFIREGGVVAVKGTERSARVLSDPSRSILYDGPLVVLTSRVSASASEILAGAMKDYGRAVIVGDGHTFGKGTVQSVFPLPSGQGALKVTTALYFRPGGESTQHSGVSSDVIVPSLFASDSFGESTQPYSLPAQAIEPFRSERANGNGDAPRYQPVTPQLISALGERSAGRIADSEAFQKLLEDLEERESDDGVVPISEILQGDEEAEVAEKASEDEEDEDALSPQAEEALLILADMLEAPLVALAPQ